MLKRAGFILERGISAIKFTLACQMGRTKLCPRTLLIFKYKVFENITDDKIDMTAALYFEIYSLLLSQLSFSSSFVSVFVFCTFSSCS